MVKKSGEVDPTPVGPHTSAAKYKGVRKRKWGKWVCEIRLPNSRDRIWLGSHDSPEKAARAFDAAQLCLRGTSANFNFPNNPPQIDVDRPMTPAEIQAVAARFANEPGEFSHGAVAETSTTEEEESLTTCSPSISDGTTGMVEMESEVAGVESSFYEQLNLGSSHFESEFGVFNGFEDFNCGNFYSPQLDEVFDYGTILVDQNNNNDYHYNVDNNDPNYYYDASLYQDPFLWSF